jgi:hypothetical protein
MNPKSYVGRRTNSDVVGSQKYESGAMCLYKIDHETERPHENEHYTAVHSTIIFNCVQCTPKNENNAVCLQQSKNGVVPQ